ncbi:hypothetical protein LTS10_011448 [Elasticomyces elasticus]|nr:hypothetical protein LTS10_011448 [Elasticomyces elasticus]
MAACSTTLHTAELLEYILLYLPLQDLLLSQRVSKQWQAVIQGSAKARQVLFLEPSGDVKLDLFGGDCWRLSNDHIWEGIVLVNPLLSCFDTSVGRTVNFDNEEILLPVKLFEPRKKNLSDGILAKHGPTASWRGMALVSPPLRYVEPTCPEHMIDLPDHGVSNRGKLGVTIEDLAKCLGRAKLCCLECVDDACAAQAEDEPYSFPVEDELPLYFHPNDESGIKYLPETTNGWEMLAEFKSCKAARIYEEGEDSSYWDSDSESEVYGQQTTGYSTVVHLPSLDELRKQGVVD